MKAMAHSPHVLAIASHVTYGYVGNKMASFVMQVFGLDVSAIDTVRYSNHLAYRQATGPKTSAQEVAELYAGLERSGLDDVEILLSGYCPNADVVQEVGRIAKKRRDAVDAAGRPGGFFWVLDPVMGDNGRMYVADEILPAYKALLCHADLILPNQFEAELLSGIKITDQNSLLAAIAALHKDHGIPHVIVTSVRFDTSKKTTTVDKTTTAHTRTAEDGQVKYLTVIGSTATSDHRPQAFSFRVPQFPIFFSGTGDMFAGLVTARFRQQAGAAELLDRQSWRSDCRDVGTDNGTENYNEGSGITATSAGDLPLAKAVQQVLASMHAVLEKTAEVVSVDARSSHETGGAGCQGRAKGVEDDAVARHLRQTKAAEVRVVRYIQEIVDPPDLDMFTPVAIEVDVKP